MLTNKFSTSLTLATLTTTFISLHHAQTDAATLTYKIKALIDGSDTLIIKDNTLQWEHRNFAAVGRHEGRNEPTTISSTLNGQTIIDEIEWIPTWSEPVPNEIRFPTFSSIFTELNPSLPKTNTNININPIISRGSTTIEQLPSNNNEFTLKIFYDDDGIPGSTFYETEIVVNPDATNTITSQVTGSPIPPQIPNSDLGDTLTNGDFKIWRRGANTTLGNGVDEGVIWDFDFSEMTIPSSLKSAVLTLEFTPRSGGVATDCIAIGSVTSLIPEVFVGLPPIGSCIESSAEDFFNFGQFSVLPLGQVHEVKLDFLDFSYTSEQILGILNQNGQKIPMFYADDAIVSFAQLDLISDSESIPEHRSVISLLGLSLISLGSTLRKKLKS